MASAGQRFFWGPGWEAYYAQFWDKDEIINRIRSLAQGGQPIYRAALGGADEWHLIRAAIHFFGTWRAAVEAAGFDYDEVRGDIKWTRARVVKEIRRLKRAHKDISSRAVQLAVPPLFAGAVRDRTFGSWEQAVKASGIAYESVRKYARWDDGRLAAALSKLQKKGVRLNAKSVLKADSALYYAGCRHYGNWTNTLRALGYDLSRAAIRRGWTRKEILAGMKDLHHKGVHMSDSHVRRTEPALHTAACREFGSWTRARRIARISLNGSRKARTSRLPGLGV